MAGGWMGLQEFSVDGISCSPAVIKGSVKGESQLSQPRGIHRATHPPKHRSVTRLLQSFIWPIRKEEEENPGVLGPGLSWKHKDYRIVPLPVALYKLTKKFICTWLAVMRAHT